MLKEFKSFIHKNSLCTNSEVILVAVSGGADSVVLLQLLLEAGYKVVLAHCNFNLRGKESDEDEAFVKSLCLKYKIKSHFISFDTKEYAAENKISIEMAARDMRYAWFEQLSREKGYSKIATGHHVNDSIETILLNLARGTGINGVTGIAALSGKIIRPLLFATREDIELYAQSEKLEFRHDSSNDSNEYLRNIVRNKIIPTFKSINPSFEQVMARNISNISSAAQIYNEAIDSMLSKWVETDRELIRVSVKEIQKSHFAETLLFELLFPLGFSSDNVSNILQSLVKESGRMFYSESHQLLVDREFILIESIGNNTDSYLIAGMEDFHKLPFTMDAQILPGENYEIIQSHTAANLDMSSIHFPIKIRHWNGGDRFYPLGMKQAKKVSDFFTDLKIDRLTKDKIWIMESQNEIIWVIWYRIY